MLRLGGFQTFVLSVIALKHSSAYCQTKNTIIRFGFVLFVCSSNHNRN